MWLQFLYYIRSPQKKFHFESHDKYTDPTFWESHYICILLFNKITYVYYYHSTSVMYTLVNCL